MSGFVELQHILGVISIPFVEYCGTGDEISLEQFRQIVEKAEWQEQAWVKMED